jgi:Hypoxia induced protein conserved region
MSSILPALVIISMLITASILVFGVITMIRGGDFNKRNGNKLMRARVIMQGVTLLLVVLMFAAR